MLNNVSRGYTQNKIGFKFMNRTKKINGLVSIIAINYNQTQVTFEMLDSMENLNYSQYEIIIVDNGSADRSIEKIRVDYPDVIFVESVQNLGFAGGNNLGLAHASGEFVFFTNNDTEVLPGTLDPLVEKLKESDKIGMVCPKIRFHYQPDTIQFAGYTALNKITVRNNLIGYREKDTGQYDTSRKSPFGHGAAMMVKREVIQQVGTMADMYFLYYEELDWCTRISSKGFEIWYVPDSLIYHKESISTGKMSPLKTYYITRNRILYTRRNIKGFNFFLSIIYQVIISGPKNMLQFIIKGRLDLFLAYIRGYLWHLGHLFDKNIKLNPTPYTQNKGV